MKNFSFVLVTALALTAVDSVFAHPRPSRNNAFRHSLRQKSSSTIASNRGQATPSSIAETGAAVSSVLTDVASSFTGTGTSIASEATASVDVLNRGGGRGRGGNGNGNGSGNGNGNQGQNGNNNQGGGKVLLQQNIQDGSSQTGQTGDIAPGQVESATDDENFINFCTGKTKTNGLQVKTGSCNGIVMGDIPASTKMISTLILFPNAKSTLKEKETFKITLRTNNLVAGHFTNAQATYYSAPQTLDGSGQIIGHTHVTVQLIDDASGQPPPADVFAFFKGINTAQDGQGILSADVTGGLPAGKYRVCTMSSSSNHQPVLMPVAQRGAQDDCQRFTVKRGNGNTPSKNNNNTPSKNNNNKPTSTKNNNSKPTPTPSKNNNNKPSKNTGNTPSKNNNNKPSKNTNNTPVFNSPKPNQGSSNGGRPRGGSNGSSKGNGSVRPKSIKNNTMTKSQTAPSGIQATSTAAVVPDAVQTMPPVVSNPLNGTVATNSTLLRYRLR